MEYRVVLVESEEGFSVSCPALRGCHSQGSTLDEALDQVGYPGMAGYRVRGKVETVHYRADRHGLTPCQRYPASASLADPWKWQGIRVQAERVAAGYWRARFADTCQVASDLLTNG